MAIIKCPKCDTDNPSDSKYCKECATPLPPSKEIPVTKTIETPTEELTRGSTFAGRYEIIEELGKGGMGKVYRVEDKKIKEEVALKLIKPEIASDKKTIERFSNELKMARKIRHKNVCAMYDLGEEKGTHYITMEYVPGEDLKSFIRRAGPLNAGKTLFIVKQVCEGLAEAHRLGVIHRDLKPQNIMIDKEGNARIMDFGIARSVKGKGITGAGVMVGTPEYMSPEQVEGKEADQRSDIYSLGVILYEMVTGRVPFEGDTPFTIGVKHKSEAPTNPRELNSQIPEDLSSVILKCLEKDKEKRYQSAGEVRSELERIEQGLPTTKRVEQKKKPFTSREITVQFNLRKVFIPAVVVIVAVIVGLMIWSPWKQKESAPIPSDKPSLAIIYFENNTGDENLDHWRKMISDLLITDLSQSKYIRVLTGENLFDILRRLDLLDSKSYSLEDLIEIAEQSGVRYILVGKFAKAGENIRIDYQIQEPSTGKIQGSQRVQAKGLDRIFSLVDEITTKVKKDLNLTPVQIDMDIDYFVGKITTNSPEALAYFSEGLQAFNMLDYPKSIQLMEKAIEIDPDFAWAYAMIHAAYYNSGYKEKSLIYGQKAFDLRDKLSERQRYAIEGTYYMIISKKILLNKAIEAFRKLLELYPEDSIGNNHLGLIYAWLEEWEKAVPLYEIQRKLKNKGIVIYGNLASAYRAMGNLDKVKEVYEDYINNVSEHFSPHRSLAGNYIRQRQFDLAQKEINRALNLAPDYRYNPGLIGDLFLFKGDLASAEEEYSKLLNNQDARVQASGRSYLRTVFLLKGQMKKAKEQLQEWNKLAREAKEKEWELDSLLALAYLDNLEENYEEAQNKLGQALNLAVELDNMKDRIFIIHRQGLVYLRMNSLDKARATAGKIRTLVEESLYKRQIRYYDHLMGEIELKKGNFTDAIDRFEKALDLAPYDSQNKYALFRNSLALAFYKKGDFDKAREEYERMILSTYGRLSYGDLYAKSFYMLGKIYEQQGDNAKAIEHYEKFLNLWKGADLGIAEVEEAKKRLAGLKR